MKKMLREILKDSFVFFGLLAIVDFIIAIVIYPYTNTIDEKTYSFFQVFSLLFTNQEQDFIINNSFIEITLILEKILDTIILAILTGFIFSRVINRKIDLKLHNTLILRRRTSEGVTGGLNVSFLIGNPHNHTINNLSCTLSVRTGKKKGITPKDDEYNAETFLESTISSLRVLRKYYTFYFPISMFPNSFWQHYLEYLDKTESGKKSNDEYGYWNKKDTITVYISGLTGSSGGQFLLVKEYSFEDIVFDKNLLHPKFNSSKKINWKYFDKLPMLLSDEEQKKMLADLHSVIDVKTS